MGRYICSAHFIWEINGPSVSDRSDSQTCMLAKKWIISYPIRGPGAADSLLESKEMKK